MLDLTHYAPEHRLELERLLGSPEWQETIRSGLIEEVQAARIEPRNTRAFIDTVVDQLLAFNEAKVKALAEGGCEDKDRLLDELSKWPDRLKGKDPVISFLGLNVTAGCNFDPKCLYCNQLYVQPLAGLDRWKRIIAEVTAGNGEHGPYIYITGGETLLLEGDIWGDDGLIRFATEKGAGVNVNTNAAMITPEIALRFIKAGLARLHISLDTADRDVQNELCGGPQFDAILQGIYNVQLARDVVGVPYPGIHTNCVLTNRNLDLFPRLFAFILEKHKQTADGDDPFVNDLFPHVVPVGGKENDDLRPSEDEFRRFYDKVWPEVCAMWDRYQEQLAVPEDKRKALFGYWSNPFLRAEHRGGLDAYAKASAEGRYGKLALARSCYVAPTQAAFTPDGNQYRCGSHAIRRILPIGNIIERGVFDSIRASIAGLDNLPQEEHCYGCALATLYINQSVEARLKEKVAELLKPRQQGR
ncbi:MAG: radical SAM protein [Candidatus Brocadiae bacterium]|nr:radical SAM protein [Candidatus Brocadiia bacterium]